MMSVEDRNVGRARVQAAAATIASSTVKLSAKRKWLFRFLAILLGPALALGILEVSLRAVGYGYTTSFFLDGTKIEEEPAWIDNADFGLWIFPRKYEGRPKPVPFLLPKEKGPNTYRIFVLGESAAMGFPDPSLSFARVLEVMLRASFPATRFEVVNCSMVAINSHGVLQIARQCAEYQPDLIVVHLGNNEVVGPFGAAGVLGPFSSNVGVARMNLALKRSRCGQLIDEVLQRISQRGKPKEVWNGMSMLLDSKVSSDDTRLANVYANFRTNLQDIVRSGRDAGAQVVLCTVPVNLKNCAPFASVHSSALAGDQLAGWQQHFNEGVRLQAEKKYTDAIRSFREAEKTDAGYAELAYRLAQCQLATGDKETAREAFSRARDLDALRFRSDSTVNRTTREVAASWPEGVRLADAEQALAKSDATGVPGEELFLEHVHMTFKGNYLLAKNIYDTITSPPLPGLVRSGIEAPAALAEQIAGEQLAHTDWSDLKHQAEMYERLIKAPPFTFQFDHAEDCQRWEKRLGEMRSRLNTKGKGEAIDAYAKAALGAKGDWMIRSQFGELLVECGKHAQAEHQLREAVAHFRHAWDAQCLLGGLEMMGNHLGEAEKRFRNVLRFNPSLESGYLGLADVLARQGKSAEAVAILERQLREKPKNMAIIKMIGSVLVRAAKYDEAKEWISQGLEIDQDEPDLHVDLGLIAMKEKKIDQAIEQFNAALRIKPDWPEVVDLLQSAEQERK
jgi:tetratricopeptide (TPR) repeat protein